MAPEILLEDVGVLIPKKLDVYSFGIMTWELVRLEKPLLGYTELEVKELHEKNMVKDVLLDGLPEDTDELFVEIISRCTCFSAIRRPLFPEIAEMFDTL
mgnify:CR=1 FL=1